MYSNKSYFIFAIGAGIWVIMKLKHILGLLKKEKASQRRGQLKLLSDSLIMLKRIVDRSSKKFLNKHFIIV